jgi:CheY-like chemotaxis protein
VAGVIAQAMEAARPPAEARAVPRGGRGRRRRSEWGRRTRPGWCRRWATARQRDQVHGGGRTDPCRGPRRGRLRGDLGARQRSRDRARSAAARLRPVHPGRSLPGARARAGSASVSRGAAPGGAARGARGGRQRGRGAGQRVHDPPAASRLAGRARRGGAPGRSRAGPATRSRVCGILVVDDQADSTDSLAMLLRLRGHEVWTAADGRARSESSRVCAPTWCSSISGCPG